MLPATPVSSKPGRRQPSLYVFNSDTEEGGFVIVAGDDKAGRPILGYSDHGRFDYDTAPDNLKALLAQYAEQIESLRDLPETTSVPQKMFKSKADGAHSVTGCMATAVA